MTDYATLTKQIDDIMLAAQLSVAKAIYETPAWAEDLARWDRKVSLRRRIVAWHWRIRAALALALYPDAFAEYDE